MSEKAFPVSISLVMTPGFHETAVQEAGYQDTYHYFTGISNLFTHCFSQKLPYFFKKITNQQLLSCKLPSVLSLVTGHKMLSPKAL